MSLTNFGGFFTKLKTLTVINFGASNVHSTKQNTLFSMQKGLERYTGCTEHNSVKSKWSLVIY